MSSKKWIRRVVMMAAAMPSAVWAHAGTGTASGLWVGISHPFSGLDHLLAMVAVGIWAAQSGGRSVWVIPATFVSLMLGGGAAALAGWPLPCVEQGISVSLLVLGLLIASACRMNVWVSTIIVGFFAVFHGHTHGAEIPLASGALIYSAGFALASALLHGLGIGGALLIRQQLSRLAGIAIALSGVYYAMA